MAVVRINDPENIYAHDAQEDFTEENKKELETRLVEEEIEEALSEISKEFLSSCHVCEVLRYDKEEVVKEIELWNSDEDAARKVVQYFVSSGYNVEVNHRKNNIAIRIMKN
jgi:hypothetical protein